MTATQFKASNSNPNIFIRTVSRRNPPFVHRFRNDLRVHDNECLNTAAANESISVDPVYCFNPRDYDKSSSGFDKTGPYPATFLIKSISDLRLNLQSRGSDLVVRIGKPEIVLVELAKAIGANAVYAHRDEVDEGGRCGGEVLLGKHLVSPRRLAFKLEETPSNYGGFREKVQCLEVRKTIAALDQKRLPCLKAPNSTVLCLPKNNFKQTNSEVFVVNRLPSDDPHCRSLSSLTPRNLWTESSAAAAPDGRDHDNTKKKTMK